MKVIPPLSQKLSNEGSMIETTVQKPKATVATVQAKATAYRCSILRHSEANSSKFNSFDPIAFCLLSHVRSCVSS
jgi:hypothetical protein